MLTLLEQIQQLPDPRQASKCTYQLSDVVFMGLCGLLVGADDWEAIACYAKEKEDWFRQFLSLPDKLPSPDTFNRVFSLLDPESFHDLFITWVKDVLLRNTYPSGVIAVDGKTQRGSRTSETEGIHTVNAWSTEAGVCLGQLKTEEKSNEIKAVPDLLKKLAIKGCLITADAMSCQKKIAKQVLSQEADYLLAVKQNQPKLHNAIEQQFMAYWATHPEDQPDTTMFSEQSNSTHGRGEHRRCWTLPATALPSQFEAWGIQMIVAVQYDRVKGKRKQSYIRYFISSRSMEAADVLRSTRQHWAVENSLHWVLDVAFNEDHCRARQGFAAENLATARQIALNLLKQDSTTRLGIKNKRKRCGWSQKYLENILGLVS